MSLLQDNTYLPLPVIKLVLVLLRQGQALFQWLMGKRIKMQGIIEGKRTKLPLHKAKEIK
ncbi:hypothetical protein F9995_04580 [Bacteroides salyersiae]|jgi:hypothetical protein|uniref:hypothetical protein n=1 Tax=Bacteroides salyersiae TaxID=291644 RepID=UPI00125E334C|nr:hypothetical protein [Bacteroides salyersiae]KAB5349527.1 hypothetical protein GAA62_05135 [Bacteroides salyersiae]KAB5353940.1 hypothetical protein GAA37_08245 [Bacteroides salyersiae]KAB5363304.1 hypothetical protein F9967_06790 [Bacteroides salyersiae]KAB5371104.1 hypothetical protein GAA00_00975 [Bacteroides salyersiae]KAB5377533.1 hypothetical protein F9993_04630 [Bacteroides salyersiae]